MKKILKALGNDVPFGILVTTAAGRIKSCNPWLSGWTRFTPAPESTVGEPGLFPDVARSLSRLVAGSGDGSSPDTPAPHDGACTEPSPVVACIDQGQGRLESFLAFSFLDDDAETAYAFLFHDPSDTSPFHQCFVITLQRLQQIQSDQLRLVTNLERANAHLLRSEKLAGIGQLAAGVAHEINNPIGYVFSNLKTLAGYMHDLLRIIDAADQVNALDDLRQLKNALEYDYIRDDVQALINESEEGIGRVKKIISALKDFSHMDEDGFRKADLHRGFESTLNIINNELRHKAKVVKEYGDLPLVECNVSQVNQVFMNMMINATHAMQGQGTITIRTGHDDTWVWFEVEDDGKSMDAETVSRIFEPFFTTKPVGQGTGLGLSLSYSIIQKHRGHIDVFSEPNQGTRFRVFLPIEQSDSDTAGDALNGHA
ncbi:MAG: ATP-binding protein [Burkholderiaceae bacterium]